LESILALQPSHEAVAARLKLPRDIALSPRLLVGTELPILLSEVRSILCPAEDPLDSGGVAPALARLRQGASLLSQAGLVHESRMEVALEELRSLNGIALSCHYGACVTLVREMLACFDDVLLPRIPTDPSLVNDVLKWREGIAWLEARLVASYHVAAHLMRVEDKMKTLIEKLTALLVFHQERRRKRA
jgi:hypothetical protein